ncbi:MAG: DUF1045 domain-containing protein [Beijerinckiaceae bacterium]
MHRYAIYLAPDPETNLWGFGSRFIGYDADTGAEHGPSDAGGLSPDVWAKVTEAPRLYGFHATLKAPMRLKPDATFAGFDAALTAFASVRSAFDAGPLGVNVLPSSHGGGFVALTPQRPSDALAQLERDAVTEFDAWRAPLTADEMARRDVSRLSERQLHYLETLGYPFVLEEFRCHLTLTGATILANDLADALAERLAIDAGSTHLLVDALVLFGQPEPGARFHIVKRYPLAA